ncbi:MAG: hypothetical protein IT371_06565 [Deltaproteobacteria bacterium]|nr:hypothetical protein [Deltaproteobacteria bacterium]
MRRHRTLALALVLLSAAACRFDRGGRSPVGDGGALADAGLPSFHDATGDRGADLALLPPPDASLDARGAPDLPTLCAEGPRKCSGDDALTCQASGAYAVERTCGMGCNAATGACYVFQGSNGASVQLVSGAGAMLVQQPVVLDTTSGALQDSGGRAQPFPSGVAFFAGADRCALVLDRLTIAQGAVLRIRGRRPLMIVARTAITVNGALDASAEGATPGPGGRRGGGSNTAGEGCGGGPAGFSSNGTRGGGAGASFGGRGGRGGGGAEGVATCGDPCLAGLVGGSGGGGGRTGGGSGGGGGGALQLTAGAQIVVGPSGLIRVGGGGGQGGSGWPGGGGGGGSGGGLLLEAPRVALDGLVAANGGGGGGGGASFEGGKSGTDGRGEVAVAEGGKGGRSIFGEGGKGGTGSGGGALDGGGGAESSSASGGGGGGAGRICVRTRSGAFDGAGLASPAAGSAAVVQQQLHPQ